ncbi:MAG: DUF2341 domain-containing protein [Ignavibacteria bacterium]|nr:DUF2341 domain-containing protein [Ignavibacteria bacterium]MCC7159685.1 DUF2341 domain-containing protein [Ignavibacteria bacterium]
MKRYRLIVLSFIFLSVFTKVLISQNCNCLNGWIYRAPLVVTNPNASAYTAFEVKDTINTLALITAGKMKADGGDIRFTDSLCNPIGYWVESGINTASTVIWIRVPNLPASSYRTIYMYYGNAAAASLSSQQNTFKFFEGFDGNTLQKFTEPCGAGTVTVSGGNANFNWASDKVIVSDTVFSRQEVYTAEMNVTACTGNWPVLVWVKNDANQRSYGVLVQNSSLLVRIGKSGVSVGACQGHNFTVQNSFTNPVGLWTTTWAATGDIRATFPGVTPMQTTDTEIPRDTSLRLGIGGISSGAGTLTVDWVRARRWAAIQPIALLNTGLELSAPRQPGGTSVSVLGSTSLRFDWADSSTNEDKFMIERSTNGGTNWSLRDSVAAGIITYTDNGLTQNSQYCYRVYAKNCVGISANSPQACGTTSFTGLSQNAGEIPKVFDLHQNFPNPFNPVTNIMFDLPKQSIVKLTIYDALGKTIAEPVNTQLEAGVYNVNWNASTFASGIYFYRIHVRQAGSSTDDFGKELKMVLVK